MTLYVGIIDGARNVWAVRIPDLVGVVGGGETPERAISSAAKAAREWAANVRDRGQEIPAARSLAQILESGEVNQGEAPLMIPLLLEAGQIAEVNLSFDVGLLDEIDAAAARQGLTRAAFLASAAREKIAARR